MEQKLQLLYLSTWALTVALAGARCALASTSGPALAAEPAPSAPFEPPDELATESAAEADSRRLGGAGAGFKAGSCPPAGAHLGDQQEPQQEDLLSDLSGLAETRLSSFARPTFYTLRLKADPTKRKFTGQLMIKLNVSAEADADGFRYLTLNAGNNLQINKAFYVYNSRGGLQVPATRLGRRLDLITLDFYPNLITAGQGLLLLVYAGHLNETHSQGLFLHHSRNPKALEGQEVAGHELAGLATHMQPSFARRLLPCWDEPQFKTPFSVIAVLPFRGYEALSNMAVKKKSISVNCAGQPTQEIEFQTTPPMSSYLLTLLVGHYEHLEAFTNSNCRVRVFVYANMTRDSPRGPLVRHKLNSRRWQAKLPLSVAVAALNHLEELFGLKYPLAKLDLIGVRNFQGGGMENWGAIVFNENYLLYDNTTSAGSSSLQLNGGRSRPKLEAIPLVVSHELAHQWFGNLVTASDWRYLWLNEGFAQFFMYELANHLFPERGYWDQFLEDIRASALQEDELVSTSHSLEPLDGPTNAEESLNIFDQITYNKGAVIVQMLQTFLGRDLFYAGLRSYLAANAYKSVRPQRLWQAFEEVGRLPEGRLDNLMGIWCVRDGYPLLTVEAYDDGLNWSLKIRQERFTPLRVGGEQPPEPANKPGRNITQRPWVIPVSVASERHPRPEARYIRLDVREKQSTTFTFLLEETSSIVNLPRASIGSWLKLNFNATGFYRVNYRLAEPAEPAAASGSAGASVDLLRAMAPAIRAKRLTRSDRFNLVDDLFALTRSGHKGAAYYLAYLSEAFSDETDSAVLRPIVDSLRSIEALVSNLGELWAPFQAWVQRYLRSVRKAAARQAAATNSPQQRQQLRETDDLIEASEAHFNEPQSVGRAAEHFRRAFRSARVSPEGQFERELRAALYSAALSESERALAAGQVVAEASPVFQRLLAGYESKSSGTERHAISWALGSVRDPQSQSQLLNLTLVDLYFRPSDAHTLLDSLARSSSGRELIWAHLSAHHGHLQEKSMLAPTLRALLAGGLVERAPSGVAGQQARPIENQLRALYELYGVEHGKLLSTSIELLLINSQWLARNQDGLQVYLAEPGAATAASAAPV